eukprot:g22331.t1
MRCAKAGPSTSVNETCLTRSELKMEIQDTSWGDSSLWSSLWGIGAYLHSMTEAEGPREQHCACGQLLTTFHANRGVSPLHQDQLEKFRRQLLEDLNAQPERSAASGPWKAPVSSRLDVESTARSSVDHDEELTTG